METERLSPRYSGIDVWDPSDILDAMVEGQFAAVAAVRAARRALETAALAIEPRLRDGGRLVYAGLQLAAEAPAAVHRRRARSPDAIGRRRRGRDRARREPRPRRRDRRQRRADRGRR